MKTRTIIQEIAARIIARQNCIKANNQEWLKKHSQVLADPWRARRDA